MVKTLSERLMNAHLKQLSSSVGDTRQASVTLLLSALSSPPLPPPGQLQTGPCDLQPGEQNTTLRRELKQFLGWARKHASGCSAVSIKLYDEWRAWLQKTHRMRLQVGKQLLHLSHASTAGTDLCSHATWSGSVSQRR